jgi:two-component system, OmpR family, sensor histidine kinase SenX3
MTSLRPMLPWLAVGASALALVWALAGLHAVFREERADAHAASDAQRRVLEEYAEQALRESLAERLRAVREAIDAAESDPLRSDRGLFLQRGTSQVLPRGAQSRTGTDAPARALHEALLSDTTAVDAEPGSPWAARLAGLRSVRRALERDDEPAIERTVRELLRERAHYRIAAPLDIAHALALVEILITRSHPNPELLARMLRDGFDVRPPILGLQRALLRTRQRFTRGDLLHLSGRIAELSERAGVPYDDFVARVREEPASRVPADRTQREPYVVDRGRWYIEPGEDGRAAGVQIDLAAQIATIDGRMRARHLLEIEDRMRLDGTDARPVPAALLDVRVESPRWAAARTRADSLYALKSALGLLCGVLAFAILVLASRAHERRLRLLAQRSEFVAAVSHELRTPLASIRLQAETLARRLAGRPEARDYPERIVRDVDGLHFLVENILSYNRLERGGWRPQLARVELRAFALQIQQGLDGQVPRKLEVIVEPSADIALRVDPDLMRLLLANLLRNAAQHSERDPALVRIACEERRGARILRVSDSGVGIPKALQARVFEDFFRGNPASPVRGSGLGLAICRRIVRAHGGRIRIATSSPLGTTFEIELPAQRDEESET